MIYNTYGSTGIKVSAIGFGSMRFSDQKNVDACASLVKAAYDKDINYFDTAPGYGKSEELLGVAFKEMKKTRTEKPFYVSSKSMKADPSEIRRDVETSLKRMNLDYLDFCHLWCIMSLDAYRDRKAKGALAEFERLKSEGLIKHICVSTHMTGPDIAEMLADYPFEGILLGYSAMNFPYRDAGLDAAAKLGMGLAVMNPLGGGIIPQNPDRFEFVKTQPEETAAQAALRFLINDPRITLALVGLSSIDQLNEAIAAVDGFKPIPPETISKIRDSLQQCLNELCTSCNYCDNCPEGIPVPKMMDIYNHHVLSDDPLEMIDRMRWHWDIDVRNNHLEDCTQCGQCEEVCTQKLPICDRFETIRANVEKFLASDAAKKED